MPTVVLVGFSCAGKSTLAKLAHKRWPDLQVLDSDGWLARGHLDERGEAHIFNLFVALGRDRALQRWTRQERAFLAQQERSAQAVLIAAGPALVSRKQEWQQFVDRVEPSFIYLVQSTEQAADGLRRRRTDQIASGLVQRPHFGSWDEGVLTAPSGNEWVDVPPDQVVPNVEKHMRQPVEIYERLTPGADRFSIEEARSAAERERIL